MRYNITPEMLQKIVNHHGNKTIVENMAKYLPEVLDKFEINNDNRVSEFLGQLAHESDHFKTLQEYASGNAYEGRSDLGNVRKGDGHRFKGRGPIQITGRANYERYGEKLGIDLVNNPDLALDPRISLLIAGQYWDDKGLNAWADAKNTKQITRKINGGYNGLQSRLVFVERARKVVNEAKMDLLKPRVVEHKEEPKVVEPVPVVSQPESIVTESQVSVIVPSVQEPVVINPVVSTNQTSDLMTSLYQDSDESN